MAFADFNIPIRVIQSRERVKANQAHDAAIRHAFSTSSPKDLWSRPVDRVALTGAAFFNGDIPLQQARYILSQIKMRIQLEERYYKTFLGRIVKFFCGNYALNQARTILFNLETTAKAQKIYIANVKAAIKEVNRIESRSFVLFEDDALSNAIGYACRLGKEAPPDLGVRHKRRKTGLARTIYQEAFKSASARAAFVLLRFPNK